MDKQMKTILTILVLVGLAIYFKIPEKLGIGGATAGQPDVVVNPTPTTSTLTLNLKDMYQAGTTVTGDHSKVYSNGVLQTSTLVSGNTTDVSPGSKLVIYAAHNSTDYYTKREEYSVTDATQQTLQMNLCAIDTSPSIIWYNENDQPSTNVTMGAGSTESFDVQVKASSYKCVGNPQISKSLGLAFYYNTSAYSKVALSGADVLSCPTFLTASKAGYVYQCYEAEGIANNAKFRDAVTLTAKSSVDPTGYTNYTLNVTVIDKDYDFHALTDKEIAAFADEDGNNLGMTSLPGTLIGMI